MVNRARQAHTRPANLSARLHPQCHADGSFASINVTEIAFELPAIFDLTIAVSGYGDTSPVSGVHAYDVGSDVSVTAIPDVGHRLSHWLLDGVEVSFANPYVVTMDGNKTLTAVFVRVRSHH